MEPAVVRADLDQPASVEAGAVQLGNTHNLESEMSKVWLITGAGRGIGAHISKAALNSGDRVVVTGRRQDQLHKTYSSYGNRVLVLELDEPVPANTLAAVAAAQESFGCIDVLVNNAGYSQLGLFEEVEPAYIEQQFQTGVFGLMHMTRAVLPVMRKQRSGHIINLASVGGFMGFAGASIYCAAKFAVEGFSESLSLEVAPFGINVTIVEPGFFSTDALDVSFDRHDAKRIVDYEDAAHNLLTNCDIYDHKLPAYSMHLGNVLVEVAALRFPPLRFVAGSDAVRFARIAYDRRQSILDAFASLSLKADGNESTRFQ